MIGLQHQDNQREQQRQRDWESSAGMLAEVADEYVVGSQPGISQAEKHVVHDQPIPEQPEKCAIGKGRPQQRTQTSAFFSLVVGCLAGIDFTDFEIDDDEHDRADKGRAESAERQHAAVDADHDEVAEAALLVPKHQVEKGCGQGHGRNPVRVKEQETVADLRQENGQGDGQRRRQPAAPAKRDAEKIPHAPGLGDRQQQPLTVQAQNLCQQLGGQQG